MDVEFGMFCPSMKDRISCEVSGTEVVTIKTWRKRGLNKKGLWRKEGLWSKEPYREIDFVELM